MRATCISKSTLLEMNGIIIYEYFGLYFLGINVISLVRGTSGKHSHGDYKWNKEGIKYIKYMFELYLTPCEIDNLGRKKWHSLKFWH